MLYLISIGLEQGDLTLRGLEAARACQRLYIEFYTTSGRDIKWLEKIVGKKITEVKRGGLEEDSERLLDEAEKQDIGVLAGGDVLFATTHLSIVREAWKRGIETEIIHGPGIFQAALESGLSPYKFGGIVTIPRWQKNFKPRGFYKTIQANKKMGLHTLILLEIDMGGKEAVGILKDIEKKMKKKIFRGKIISVSNMGSDNQTIRFSSAKTVEGAPPAALILPGKLNDFEKEFLEEFTSQASGK